LSAWHHIALIRWLDPGRSGQPHATTLALALSLFLAIVGIAMVIYLAVLRAEQPRFVEERSVTSGTHQAGRVMPTAAASSPWSKDAE